MKRTHTRASALVWLALGGALGSSGCWGRDSCADHVGCRGNVLQTCIDASYGPDVTAHACEGTCIDYTATHDAFCALDDKPDANCEDGYGPRCEGATLVECHAGYETKRLDCAQALLSAPGWSSICIGDPLHMPACGRVENPDPRCDATLKTSHFCEGDVGVYCYGPYPYGRAPFSSAEACMSFL